MSKWMNAKKKQHQTSWICWRGDSSDSCTPCWNRFLMDILTKDIQLSVCLCMYVCMYVCLYVFKKEVSKVFGKDHMLPQFVNSNVALNSGLPCGAAAHCEDCWGNESCRGETHWFASFVTVLYAAVPSACHDKIKCFSVKEISTLFSTLPHSFNNTQPNNCSFDFCLNILQQIAKKKITRAFIWG